MKQRPLRMALLFNWHGRGDALPKYGLVDDEILLRKGKAPFIATDGQQLIARKVDLILLEAAPTAATPAMVA